MNKDSKAMKLFDSSFDISALKQIVEEKVIPEVAVELPEESSCRHQSFYMELMLTLRKMQKSPECRERAFFQLNPLVPEDLILMGQASKAGFRITYERYEGAWIVLDLTK